jgi:hypothetical protein
MTEVKDELAQALSQLQADLEPVKKGETADTGSYTYSYADIADIAAAVYPLLGKYGLAYCARPKFIGDRYVLLGELLHVSGGVKDAEFPLPDRASVQQLGSALTYGRRYLLGCLTGVVTEADDDGKAASQTPTPVKKAAPKKQLRRLPDTREPLWADIKTAREAKGWSSADVQADFAVMHDGKKLMDATADELQAYLAVLSEDTK